MVEAIRARPVSLPWIRTPCILSHSLSKAAGCQVYLKLENLQPSGSFKSRGVGQLMVTSLLQPSSATTHFYCSSGGNAGLACAHAAIALKKPATIVVPMSTSETMMGKLKDLGVEVHQFGRSWFEADEWMRKELVNKDDGAVYVPPFDHPEVWRGNSSMVTEIWEDLGAIDGIICSVGGGGLFNGVMEGLSGLGEPGMKTVVLAMETIGADSLHQSIVQGQHIRLSSIDSIATSLGATRVSDRTFSLAQDRARVVSMILSDAEAVRACLRFADEERFLVEPACGVSIAPVYLGKLKEVRERLGPPGGLSDEDWATRKIVVVVCGGSNISLELLEAYNTRFA